VREIINKAHAAEMFDVVTINKSMRLPFKIYSEKKRFVDVQVITV